VELLVELTKVNIPKDILNNSKNMFIQEIRDMLKDYADIYSKPGTKIRFMAEGGNDYQKTAAKKVLTVTQIYTLKSANIESYSTTFVLEEFPDNVFNSSLFFRVLSDE
jgi:hypothetical protein